MMESLIDYKSLQDEVHTIIYYYNAVKQLIIVVCDNSFHLRDTSTISKKYLNKAKHIISFAPTQADREEFGSTRIRAVGYNNLDKLIEEEIACESPQWRIDRLIEKFKDLPLGGVKEETTEQEAKDEEEGFTPAEMLKIKTIKLPEIKTTLF